MIDSTDSVEDVIQATKSLFTATLLRWGIGSLVVSYFVTLMNYTEYEKIGFVVGWIVITMNFFVLLPGIKAFWVLTIFPLTRVTVLPLPWHLIAILLSMLTVAIHIGYAYYLYLTINGLNIFNLSLIHI